MAKVINQIIEWIPTTDKRKPVPSEEVLVRIPFVDGNSGEKCISIERAVYTNAYGESKLRFWEDEFTDARDYYRDVTHWAYAYRKLSDVKVVKEKKK